MKLSEITPDNWLGERLGKPVWHLEMAADAATWQQAIKPPAFVDARVPVSDTKRQHALLAAGFLLADTTVTLDRPAVGPCEKTNTNVRMAQPADVEIVTKLASRNFITDRFHVDPNISTAVANQIKSDWARNYFAGARGDWMIVGEFKGQVSGFLLLLYRDGYVIIDLIAVDTPARRKGLAADMIARSALTCRPGTPMRVGTQIANISSLSFYESLGFRVSAAEHVFHYHVS